MSFLNGLVSAAASEMVSKLEAEFRGAIDATEPGLALVDIQRRCTVLRVEGSPFETLLLDGRPILEWLPVECERQDREDGSIVMRYTRQFRRL